MTVPEKDAPFTEPYAMAGNSSGFKSKGPTAEAVKRALAHLGFMDWNDNFDQQWNQTVNEAAAAWKKKRGLIPGDSNDGSWGKKAHDVMRGTWYEKDGAHLDAFDGGSQKLLQQEKAASQPDTPPIERVRKKITEFAERCIGQPDWYYSQNRAVDISVKPEGPNTSDCSATAIQVFRWARDQTGVNVPDPAKQGWSGYGNTNYYEDDWPKTSGPYQVGDLAHYDGHVCICYHPGNADTADWLSFGSEPPSSRKLHYRTDFRFVVRPKLVA